MSEAGVNPPTKGKDGLFGTLVASAIIAVASLCSGILVARSLDPELRGVLATIILWPTMLSIFCDLGLGFAVSYFVAKDPGSSSALWTTSVVFGLLVGSAVGAAGARILPQLLDLSAPYAADLRFAMWIVPASLLSGYQSMLLLGAKRIREYNLIRTYLTVGYVAGVVILVALQLAAVRTFALAYITTQISGAALATLLVLWRIRPHLVWSAPLFKPLFTYGGKVYLTSVVAQTNLRLDQMIMSAVVPLAELGKYVVAVSMASMMGPLYMALGIVALPRIAHQANARTGGLESVRYFQLGILMGLPLVAFGVWAMPWLLPLLFGDQYPGAVLPAQILMVASISQGSILVLNNGLLGLGRPGLPAIAEGLGVIITVALLLLLLPVLGSVGAAITSLIVYSTVMVIEIVFTRYQAQLPWSVWWTINWRGLAPALALPTKRRRPTGDQGMK